MIIPEQVNIKKYYVLHFHIPYLANRITLLKNVKSIVTVTALLFRHKTKNAPGLVMWAFHCNTCLTFHIPHLTFYSHTALNCMLNNRFLYINRILVSNVTALKYTVTVTKYTYTCKEPVRRIWCFWLPSVNNWQKYQHNWPYLTTRREYFMLLNEIHQSIMTWRQTFSV